MSFRESPGSRVHEGTAEEFKRWSAQCLEIMRARHTGTLQYESYVNDDESECMVLDRYRDSEALIEHTANLSEFGAAIFTTGSVYGELLGEPSAELRANLADRPVRLVTPFLTM